MIYLRIKIFNLTFFNFEQLNFPSFGFDKDKVSDMFFDGKIVLIDKPYKWSSFDVINKIRILLKNYVGIKKIKVGHAGTLDPLATGLMIVCTGNMTKKIELITKMDKEYIAEITFGGTTISFDLETEVVDGFPFDHIDNETINDALKQFLGKQMQTPPLFSAIKIDGKRAYQHARKGDNIELKKREISINELELLKYNPPVANIRINCSKGTYIRSFANDIGKFLQSGAHLSALIRTKTGCFTLKDAISLNQFEIALEKLKKNDN